MCPGAALRALPLTGKPPRRWKKPSWAAAAMAEPREVVIEGRPITSDVGGWGGCCWYWWRWRRGTCRCAVVRPAFGGLCEAAPSSCTSMHPPCVPKHPHAPEHSTSRSSQELLCTHTHVRRQPAPCPTPAPRRTWGSCRRACCPTPCCGSMLCHLRCAVPCRDQGSRAASSATTTALSVSRSWHCSTTPRPRAAAGAACTQRAAYGPCCSGC